MALVKSFPQVYLGEKVRLIFNFGPDLDVGETVGSPAVAATVTYGTHATPSAILSGSPSAIDDDQIAQWVDLTSVPADDVDYSIAVTVTTSASRVLVLPARLPVRSRT